MGDLFSLNLTTLMPSPPPELGEAGRGLAALADFAMHSLAWLYPALQEAREPVREMGFGLSCPTGGLL
ncbi:MAG: hypothetical protein DYG96_12530 [Chlorobi bacterium CHB2]|nr:hypothetical protein [Chlorobi bacterium CHB2]